MKKLISIILLITLTLALSGCGKEVDISPINSYVSCIDNKPFWSFSPDVTCYDEEGIGYDYSKDTYIQILVQDDNNLYYTQEEVDEIKDELNRSIQLLSQNIEWMKENTIYNLEQRIIELEEFDTWLEESIEYWYIYEFKPLRDIIERLDDETYSKEQMNLVIDIYHIQVSILEIEKVELERELLPEEALILAGLQFLLNEAENQLENGDE